MRKASLYLNSLSTKEGKCTIIEYPISLLLSIFTLDPVEICRAAKHKDIAERKLRFTDHQALAGFSQIDRINKLISQRRKIVDILFKNLHHSISIQKIPLDCQPSYFMIPIKAKDKFKVYRYLLLKGIDSNLEYASDCAYILKDNDYNPTTKFISEHALALNLPYSLKEKEVIFTANVLNSIKDWFY